MDSDAQLADGGNFQKEGNCKREELSGVKVQECNCLGNVDEGISLGMSR